MNPAYAQMDRTRLDLTGTFGLRVADQDAAEVRIGIVGRWAQDINLLTNPSMETASGTVTVRTNYATDPLATANVPANTGLGWSTGRWFGGDGGAGTHTYVTGATDGPLPGITTYLRKTWTVATNANGNTGFNLTQTGAGAFTGLAASTTYTVSGWLRPTGTDKSGNGYVGFFDASGNKIGDADGIAPTNLPAGTWTRLSFSFTTPPSGLARAQIALDIDPPGTPWAVGDTLDGTVLLVEAVGAPGAVQRTNQITNPAVNISLGAWSLTTAEGGTFTTTRETSTSGLTAMPSSTWAKALCVTAPGQASKGISTSSSNSSGTPVTAGLTYTISGYVVSSAIWPIVYMRVIWATASGTTVQENQGSAAAYSTTNAGQRVVYTGTAPAGAERARVVMMFSGYTLTPGDMIGATAVLCEQSATLGTYFDGSTTASATVEFAWTGTPGLSTSVQRAPSTGYVGSFFAGGYDASADPDLTPAWTGAVNNSTSELRGVGVASVSGGNYRAIVQSSQWAERGTKSVRVIPTTTTNDIYGAVLRTFSADDVGKTFTVLATCRVATAQTAFDATRARRIILADPPVLSGPQAPNVPGVYPLRWTFTVSVANQALRLVSGASVGGGDVWWDDVLLVASEYTGDYFDGDTPSTPEVLYHWTGTRHASASVATYAWAPS